MLYERWRQIVRNHANEPALHDVSLGRRWTFSQLAAEEEKSCVVSGPIAFPQGADFILTLLRAWRAGQMVCPLEPGQAPPTFKQFPAGCVHLKTTSATTGPSRAVAFTAGQLAADAENIVATMGLRPDWLNLGVVSLAHSYGFSNLVLPLLLHGIPLVVVEAPLPEMLLQAATGAEAFTLAGVPALWNVWQSAGAIPKNVKLAISAGAPLSLTLEQAVFAERRLKIHNFYGSSECGGIAYDASTAPRTEAACAGAPLKNVQVSIGGNGCLEVRGRAVGQTYWPEPSANLAEGCFRTSDLAELQAGMVYLRGRVGDQINIAGRKISPEEIERVLMAHPAVRDCLLFGAPSADQERSECIVACIVGNGAVKAEVLKQFLLERLPAWQIPREWVFVDSLGTNQRGKLSRSEWRARYIAGEL